jgi:hypothetical protein
MSIMAILEVAIGLIFTWLVLSVAVMYIQEWIVSRLGWRSDMLETYISNLVADPSLAKQFYDHPLIQALHSGSDGQQKPAYIPAAQFSMAMLDIISKMPKESALIQKTIYDLQGEIDKLGGNNRKNARMQLDLTLSLARNAVSSEGDDSIVLPMLEKIKQGIRKLHDDYPALRRVIRAKISEFVNQKTQIDTILAKLRAQSGGAPDQTPVGQFKEGLAALSVVQPQFKQAVDALISGEEGSSADSDVFLAAVRKNLEDWFNNAMDRLSGWYKRRAQTLAFIIGISVGILLNVDSLQLATQLWRDPAVRDALAAQASAFASQDASAATTQNGQQLAAIGLQISQLNVPIGWIGTGQPMDASRSVQMGDGSQKICTFSPQSEMDLFGIPLATECYPIVNTPHVNDVTGWLLKLIGLFITGAAAAQGAPFWFDILKKVVNVRANGVNSDAVALKTVQ